MLLPNGITCASETMNSPQMPMLILSGMPMPCIRRCRSRGCPVDVNSSTRNFPQLDMAKPFSDELRRQLLEAYESGTETRQELAQRFNVSLGYVNKIRTHQLRTGQIDRTPQSRHGPESQITSSAQKAIKEIMRQNPRITVNQLRERLQEKGVRLGRTRIYQEVCNLGFQFAKKESMNAAAREKISEGMKRKWAARKGSSGS